MKPVNFDLILQLKKDYGRGGLDVIVRIIRLYSDDVRVIRLLRIRLLVTKIGPT